VLLNAVAVRYAQAIFDMAKQQHQLDEQLAELIKVKLILEEHPPLSRALQSPTIPSSVKKSILQRVLAQRVSSTTLHFLYVLVDKGREAYVPLVVDCYKELLRQERGQVAVVVQSAAPLDAAFQREVEEKLLAYTGKKVEISFEVDPDLIGGLLLRVGDRIIDGTVRHQMIQIHERLSKAGTAAVGG